MIDITELLGFDPDTSLTLPDGHTRAVRRLAAHVAEARHLQQLQADHAPYAVESRRVTRRRHAIRQAATLYTLTQDPDAVAWSIARWRTVLTALGTLALIAALAWSAVGVQHTAGAGAPPGSGAWWLAWLVEPAISSVLLLCVAAEAYLASRGARLRSRAVRATEFGALAVTLTLNAAPYAHRGRVQLLVHCIGPLVATGAVACLTAVWSALDALPSPTGLPTATGSPTVDPTVAPTTPEYSGNTAPQPPAVDDLAQRRAAVRQLIATGALPPTPSATAIRTALRCGTDTARAVRDTLGAQAS